MSVHENISEQGMGDLGGRREISFYIIQLINTIINSQYLYRGMGLPRLFQRTRLAMQET